MPTKLIGAAANQVPTNGDLGTLAFQDSASVSIDELTTTGLATFSGDINLANNTSLTFKNAAATTRDALTWFTDDNLYFDNQDGDHIFRNGTPSFSSTSSAFTVQRDATFEGSLTVSGLATVGDLTLTAGNPEIITDDNSTVLSISASTAINTGGNIVLVPEGHAAANDIIFNSGSTNVGRWDDSADTWTFGRTGTGTNLAVKTHNSTPGSYNEAALNFILSSNSSSTINWDIIAEQTALTWDYEGGEKMRLSSAGDVGIGTTSPASKLHVVGTITGTVGITSAGVYNNTTGTGANLVVDSAGGFARSTSSRRYKNTIQNATHGLAELLTLRPVTFKHNNNADAIFGGLIAEEVHDAGLTEFVEYDKDDKPDALQYGNMISLCIKAIQELKQEIDELKRNA